MPPSFRKVVYPNPFYVVLLLVSVAFLATVLGYLIGPFVQQQALDRPGAGPGPASKALTAWLDRHGPAALAVEFGVMLVAGLLAMAFDGKGRRPGPK